MYSSHRGLTLIKLLGQCSYVLSFVHLIYMDCLIKAQEQRKSFGEIYDTTILWGILLYFWYLRQEDSDCSRKETSCPQTQTVQFLVHEVVLFSFYDIKKMFGFLLQQVEIIWEIIKNRLSPPLIFLFSTHPWLLDRITRCKQYEASICN